MTTATKVPTFLKYTLKSLRTRKDKTLSEAAKDLGITPPTLRKWEDDSRCITFGDIEKIEKYYNIPRDFIFFGTDYGFNVEASKEWKESH